MKARGTVLLSIAAAMAAGCSPAEKPFPGHDGAVVDIDAGAGGQDDGPGDASNDVAPPTSDAAPPDIPPWVRITDGGPGDAGDAGISTGAPSVCPSASATASTAPALIGWSDSLHALVAMRGDGSIVSVSPVHVGPVQRSGDFVLAVGRPADGSNGDTYQAVLVDRALQVRWTLSGGPDSPLTAYLDGATGAVVLDNRVVIMPDGTVYRLAAELTPIGPPRLDGWVPFAANVQPGNVGPRGFVKADTGETITVRMMLLGTAWPLQRGGNLIYRAWNTEGGSGNWQPGIAVENPYEVHFFPTPFAQLADADTPTTSISLIPAGVLLTVNGRPRWLLRDLTEIVDLGLPPGDDGAAATTVTATTTVTRTGDWMVVLGPTGEPRWSFRASTGEFTSLAGFSPAPARTWTASAMVNEHWAAGFDYAGRIWRVDLATGLGDYVDPAPLRPFPNPCGNGGAPLPPLVLSDGSMGLGLRDDYTAGAFFVSPGETSWRRVGQPLVNVSGVATQAVGRFLYIGGYPIYPPYCPMKPDPWLTPPAGAEAPAKDQMLLMPATSVVARGPVSITFVSTQSSPTSAYVHESGECALWGGQVHNLVTAETLDFPVKSAVWW